MKTSRRNSKAKLRSCNLSLRGSQKSKNAFRQGIRNRQMHSWLSVSAGSKSRTGCCSRKRVTRPRLLKQNRREERNNADRNPWVRQHLDGATGECKARSGVLQHYRNLRQWQMAASLLSIRIHPHRQHDRISAGIRKSSNTTHLRIGTGVRMAGKTETVLEEYRR